MIRLFDLVFSAVLDFFFFFGIGGDGFLFVGLIDYGFEFEKRCVLLNFLVFLGWGL